MKDTTFIERRLGQLVMEAAVAPAALRPELHSCIHYLAEPLGGMYWLDERAWAISDSVPDDEEPSALAHAWHVVSCRLHGSEPPKPFRFSGR